MPNRPLQIKPNQRGSTDEPMRQVRSSGSEFLSCSETPEPAKLVPPPNMAANAEPMPESDVFMNSTQPMSTKNIVTRLRTINGSVSSFGAICFSMDSSTKKYRPHSTKFQLAPCHRPVSAQTASRLRI